MNLGLYQRQKDIRVKLLLGAKETHVRGQFMFEGFLIGFIGSFFGDSRLYCVLLRAISIAASLSCGF